MSAADCRAGAVVEAALAACDADRAPQSTLPRTDEADPMLSHAELAEIAGRCYRKPWSGDAALDCEYDLLPRGADELVVAIPGTHLEDPLDWIRDLSTLPWLFPTIGVCHSGFGAGGTAVAERVLGAVRGDTRLMTVVGHSLGGALALIVGARLIGVGYRTRIVTFGGPRVAFCLNLAFWRRLRRAEQLFEYRRAGDPVPHVPMRPLFRHITRGIAIGADCGDPISNHAIGRYAADLAAMAPQAA
jgi:hypothetical protein